MGSTYGQDVGPHAFLIRLWVEPRDITGGNARVRAWVQHLQSGRDCNVTDVAALVAFVAECIGEHADALNRWAGR